MLRVLHLRNTQCRLALTPVAVDLVFDADLVQHTGQQIDLALTVHGGSLYANEQCLAHSLSSRIFIQKKKNEIVPEGEALVRALSPYVPGGIVAAELGMKKNKIRCVFKDGRNQQLAAAHAQIKDLDTYAVQLRLTLDLAHYVSSFWQSGLLSDTQLCIDLSVEKQPHAMHATAHGALTGSRFGKLSGDFLFKDAMIKGSLTGVFNQAGKWSGVGHYDLNKRSGSAVLKLRESVPLFSTGLQLEADATAMHFSSQDEQPIKAAGNFAILDLLKNEQYQLRTSGQLGKNESLFKLMTDHGTCDARVRYADQLIASAHYTSAAGKKLSTFEFDEKQNLRAVVDYQIIKSLIQRLFGIDAKGEGVLKAQAAIRNGIIAGDFSMQNGCIRLVPSYNFIKNIQAFFNVDLATARCTIENGLVELHGGQVTIPRAVFTLRTDGAIDFLHVPLIAHKMFINIHKDCFVQLSGAVTLTKREQNAKMSGCLLIDKGQLKKNIFSLIASRQLLEPVTVPFGNTIFDGQLHLTIATQKPLSIKTSFLDTQADVSLAIDGTIHEPAVTGKISLYRGSLAFPYRPLYITHGALHFTPPRLTDPDLLFVAKGRVRHFDVTLRVGGSLDHPHVSLESTPPLTDEQIITLLLIGSESGAFSLIMPTLIMNNIQHLLFGPEQSLKKLETYFKSLLSPLKNIRIVPSFTDQSGRGGLRGAIEVDVSDQLHAVIQKNFSQPEDTKFEVEYLATDDLTLRAIKDERGDLGGEFELRWKF
jgi:hypothetical protein